MKSGLEINNTSVDIPMAVRISTKELPSVFESEGSVSTKQHVKNANEIKVDIQESLALQTAAFMASGVKEHTIKLSNSLPANTELYISTLTPRSGAEFASMKAGTWLISEPGKAFAKPATDCGGVVFMTTIRLFQVK
jgi:hypothetical protein